MSEYYQSSNRQDWETPDELYDNLNSLFHFNLDAAASDNNFKCDHYFTKENSALNNSWGGRVWCNPPYSKDKNDPGSVGVREFLIKALYEWNQNPDCEFICFLVSAATDASWFQTFVFDAPVLVFLKGRLKFKGAKNSQTKGSALAIWGQVKKEQIHALRHLGIVFSDTEGMVKKANGYCQLNRN